MKHYICKAIFVLEKYYFEEIKSILEIFKYNFVITE